MLRCLIAVCVVFASLALTGTALQYKYDASDGAPSGDFTQSCDPVCNTPWPTGNDGGVSFVTVASTTASYWKLESDYGQAAGEELAKNHDWYVEATLKVVSGTHVSANPNRVGVAGIGVEDAYLRNWRVSITPSGLFMHPLEWDLASDLHGVPLLSYAMDTTDAFHTYKLIYKAFTDTLMVTVDDILVIDAHRFPNRIFAQGASFAARIGQISIGKWTSMAGSFEFKVKSLSFNQGFNSAWALAPGWTSLPGLQCQHRSNLGPVSDDTPGAGASPQSCRQACLARSDCVSFVLPAFGPCTLSSSCTENNAVDASDASVVTFVRPLFASVVQEMPAVNWTFTVPLPPQVPARANYPRVAQDHAALGNAADQYTYFLNLVVLEQGARWNADRIYEFGYVDPRFSGLPAIIGPHRTDQVPGVMITHFSGLRLRQATRVFRFGLRPTNRTGSWLPWSDPVLPAGATLFSRVYATGQQSAATAEVVHYRDFPAGLVSFELFPAQFAFTVPWSSLPVFVLAPESHALANVPYHATSASAMRRWCSFRSEVY